MTEDYNARSLQLTASLYRTMAGIHSVLRVGVNPPVMKYINENVRSMSRVDIGHYKAIAAYCGTEDIV